MLPFADTKALMIEVVPVATCFEPTLTVVVTLVMSSAATFAASQFGHHLTAVFSKAHTKEALVVLTSVVASALGPAGTVAEGVHFDRMEQTGVQYASRTRAGSM